MAKEEKEKDEDLEKTKKAEEIEEAEAIIEEKEEAKTEKGTQQIVWTPKDIEALVKLGMEWLGINLADKYLAHKKNQAEARRLYFESVSTHNRRMIYVLLVFLVGIVAFMSFLTIYEKVSGDALLFLVGTVTGYIIMSVQRLIFPSKEPPLPEEET